MRLNKAYLKGEQKGLTGTVKMLTLMPLFRREATKNASMCIFDQNNGRIILFHIVVERVQAHSVRVDPENHFPFV